MFLEFVEETGRGSEVGDALLGENGEERVRGGLEGGSVVEDGAAAVHEALDAYEVHYPTGLVIC